jgi:hypothetical protein
VAPASHRACEPSRKNPSRPPDACSRARRR